MTRTQQYFWLKATSTQQQASKGVGAPWEKTNNGGHYNKELHCNDQNSTVFLIKNSKQASSKQGGGRPLGKKKKWSPLQ